MILGDFLEPALCVDNKTTISRVAASMYKKGKEEALVFDKKTFRGILFAKDLVSKDVSDITRTQIGHVKSLVKSVKPFSEKTDADDAINAMLTNNLKSLPVKRKGSYYTVKETSLLKTLPKDMLKDKKAGDVLFYPYCISPTDTIDTARAVFRTMNAFRLAVVNDHNTIEGLVSSLDLLQAVISEQRSARTVRGERMPDQSTATTTFMQKKIITAQSDSKLSALRDLFVKNKTDAIAIVDSGKFKGVVTPNRLLKFHTSHISGVYVSLTGIQKEDPFVQSLIEHDIRYEIQKLHKIIPIDYMNFHVEKRSKGGKSQYTIHAKLVTEHGLFFAEETDWDLARAMRKALSRVERDVLKKKGKTLARRRKGKF